MKIVGHKKSFVREYQNEQKLREIRQKNLSDRQGGSVESSHTYFFSPSLPSLPSLMHSLCTVALMSSYCRYVLWRSVIQWPIISCDLSSDTRLGTTGGPSSSCEMIILRNNSHGGIIRVCMGIFTTALRNKKIRQILKKIPHLTSTAYFLLSDRLLWWKDHILESCPFRGF